MYPTDALEKKYGFELVYPGKWKNAETTYVIYLDQDYGKTYGVYCLDRTGWSEHLRSANGRITHFRTFEGAAKAAQKAAQS